MFSGVDAIRRTSIDQMIKLMVLDFLIASCVFAVVAVAVWVFIRVATFANRKCCKSVSSELPDRYLPNTRNVLMSEEFKWRRDRLFVLIYLLLSAVLIFWRSSSSSFSWNGESIRVNGEFTQFGIILNLYGLFICCIVASLFLLIPRMTSRAVEQLKMMESKNG